MSYKGWSNYETWRVAMWLDKDTEFMPAIVQSIWAAAEPRHKLSRCDVAVTELTVSIETLVREQRRPALPPPYDDLLTHVLSAVDAHEIARAWLVGRAS